MWFAVVLARDSSLMVLPTCWSRSVSNVAAIPRGWGNTVAPLFTTSAGTLLDVTRVPCRHSFPKSYAGEEGRVRV